MGELKYSHFQISEYCGKHHDSYRYGKYGDKEVEPTKKEFAEFVQKNFDEKGNGIFCTCCVFFAFKSPIKIYVFRCNGHEHVLLLLANFL